MREFKKPKLVVSACLNLKPVRYNGQEVRDEFVLRLLSHCQVMEVCPEVAIGLSVPRDRIIVYKKGGSYGLSQPSTGLELTDRMLEFSESYTKGLPEVDGFVLKSKSPSCGVSNTKVYKDKEGREFYSKGKGIFAMKVLEKFELLPVEDEGKLKNEEIKHHFLLRLFAVADLRESLADMQEVSELMHFHQRNKYLLMAHSQQKLKELGRLVASARRENLPQVLSQYRELFLRAIRKRPSKGQEVNTILHIFGHLSSELNKAEREHFFKLVEDYRRGAIGRKLLIEFLKSYAYRFENQYLIEQTFLEPYPESLN